MKTQILKNRYQKAFGYLQRAMAGLCNRPGHGPAGMAVGLQTLDLAKAHEQPLAYQSIAGRTAGKRNRAHSRRPAFLYGPSTTHRDIHPRHTGRGAPCRLNQD